MSRGAEIWVGTAMFLAMSGFYIRGIFRTDEGWVVKTGFGCGAFVGLMIAYLLHKHAIDLLLREIFS